MEPVTRLTSVIAVQQQVQIGHIGRVRCHDQGRSVCAEKRYVQAPEYVIPQLFLCSYCPCRGHRLHAAYVCLLSAATAVIEKYTRNTRFCLICNYVGKIIPALQSRCTRFRFPPLAESYVRSRLQHVIECERWVFTVLASLMVSGLSWSLHAPVHQDSQQS